MKIKLYTFECGEYECGCKFMSTTSTHALCPCCGEEMLSREPKADIVDLDKQIVLND